MTRARDIANLGRKGGISVGTSAPGSTGGYLVGVGLSAGGVPTRQLDVASGDLVVGSAITLGGNSGIISATKFSGGWDGTLSIDDTTSSTSKTTGALVITGGVGIAKSLFVGEGLSVGGTVTYDDVTNIDSVGIVTAGKGLRATTGGLHVVAGVSTIGANLNIAGNSQFTSANPQLEFNNGGPRLWSPSANTLTFHTGGGFGAATNERLRLAASGEVCVTGIVTVGAGVTISSDFIHLRDNSKIDLGISSDFQIYHDGTHNYIKGTTSADTKIIQNGNFLVQSLAGETILRGLQNAQVDLYYNNTKKIETISTGASVYGGLRLEGGGFTREHLNIVGTALNSNKVINLSDGMVHYRSVAVGGANVKLNIISNAGINTDMAIGDIMAVTVITVAGSTSHFVDQIRIDGVEASAGVTTNWSGGSVPTAGGGSGIDSYAFNVMKTGNATYVVLANQTLTSS